MKYVIEQMKKDSRISDYKINIHAKESYELFFVKGKLETLRRTDTCDKEVTVYVNHGQCKGEAQFFVYPSTTQEQIDALREGLGVTQLHFAAAEGSAKHMEAALAEMDEQTYELYLRYHLATCERPDMVGISHHTLDIFRKD